MKSGVALVIGWLKQGCWVLTLFAAGLGAAILAGLARSADPVPGSLTGTGPAAPAASLPVLEDPPDADRKGKVSGDDENPDEEHTATAAERRQIERAAEKAFDKRDYAAAEGLLRRLTQVDKDNFVPWYNLACALSLQGKADEGAAMLRRAVEQGFSDLPYLLKDPQLAAVRQTDTCKSIIARWDAILDARIEANIEAAKTRYGPRYVYEKDDLLRLAYVSAFDPVVFAKAKQEIERLTRWWAQNVTDEGVALDGQPDKPDTDAPNGAAAGRSKTPWVMVVLPTPKDYARWAFHKFGPSWQQIGGSYSNDEKTLVAQDLGATMRHEYWHVLHWRDMDRRGQRHPIWVMEGLCSLVEDVDTASDGKMVAAPSWRTNSVKRLDRAAKLTPWSLLFAMDQAHFVKSKPLANYAQSRTIFVYLAQQGKLKDWYAAYVTGFHDDSTGAKALETVFAEPIKQVEADYKVWLRALPEVPEEVRPGMASLPFAVEAGGGEGLAISSLVSGSAPRATGLKMRDVISEVNGRTVRDMTELVRVLGELEPGTEVEVVYRRGKLHGTAKVTLVPAK